MPLPVHFTVVYQMLKTSQKSRDGACAQSESLGERKNKWWQRHGYERGG